MSISKQHIVVVFDITRIICPRCGNEVPYEQYKADKFCPETNCRTFLQKVPDRLTPPARVEDARIPTLESMFIEAFRLWHKKPLKIDKRTSDHFKKLGKGVEIQAIKLASGLSIKVKASVGMGRWAEIPWIGLRHPKLTDNFEEGEYIVYLLAPDFNTLYLGIIQGITRLTPIELAERTPRLRKEITRPEGFVVGLEGHLAKYSPFNSKPDKYERGLLYSKRYDMQDLPSEDIILDDLKVALKSYRECVEKSI